MISRIAKINNGFLKYTAYRLYDMKSRLIILGICGVLSFPLLMLALVINNNVTYQPGQADGARMFLIISMMLAFLSGVIFFLLTYTGGVNCFDYYSRREKVDKSWSLPITNKHRFWGDFVSGIVPIVLVYAVSAAIGLFILNVGTKTEIWGQEDILLVASMMFAGLLTLVSIYIFAVFCAALCGRIFETVVYPTIICGIIPALIGLFGTMIFMDVWQVQIYSQLNTLLAATSPGGFLGVFFYEISRYGYAMNDLSDALIFLKPAIMIPFVLIHAGILTAAYYFGKKRKAENTGKAFVFDTASEIILSFVVFCITALFFVILAQGVSLTFGLIFGMFACTAIAFLALDVSAKRGFKKMGKAFLRYAVMFTGSIVVANVLLSANGFGAGSYLPAENRVKSARIDVAYMDNIEMHDTVDWRRSHFRNIEFNDNEAKNLIRELHKESNENPHNNVEIWHTQSYWRGMDQMRHGEWRWNQRTVTYTLNNGRIVTRFIRLNDAQTERLLPLIMTDEYKQSRIDYVQNWLDDKDNIDAHAFVRNLSQERIVQKTNNVDGVRILEAFKADYMAETFGQRFNSTDTILGRMELDFYELVPHPDGRNYMMADNIHLGIYIFPHYTNLIAELERQGLGIWNNANERYFLPSSFSVFHADYIIANYETSQGVSHYRAHVVRTEESNELINRLLEVVQPSHIIRGDGYFLTVNGSGGWRTYVVPPQYEHLAIELSDMFYDGYWSDYWDYWAETEVYEDRYYSHAEDTEAIPLTLNT
jgi:hypothetical protein